ncbi:MAG: sugar transferase [Patescibacteria group bacterium]
MKFFTRFRKLVLLLGDMVCLLLGILAALLLRYGWPISQNALEIHRIPFAIIFAVWIFVFYVGGLYGLRRSKNQRGFFAMFFTVFAINAGIAILFFYFVQYFSITPKTVLFLDLGITLALLLAWRVIFNSYISLPPLKLAILGEGSEVDEIIADLEKHPQQGYKCVFHAKGYGQDLTHLLRNKGIDVVAVAVDYRNSPELQKALFECIPLHVQFVDFVDFYEQRLQKIPLAVIDRAWFLENLNEPGKQFFSSIKRWVDIITSIMLGIVGALLTPFIALAILISYGRPIFYSQIRVGKFGESFRIYKFRSMKHEHSKETLTFVGKILRGTHVDEIPQLWNIIKGEMSFVGPRPEQESIVADLKQNIPFYNERLLVRPGVTGWAQLFDPKAQASDALKKLQYDLFYIKHRSLLLDLEIVLKTLRILVVSK